MNSIICNPNCKKQVPITDIWAPFVICTHCGAFHCPPYDVSPTPMPDPVKSIAMLITEDNFKQRQEFKLKLGMNIIGRASPNMQMDIVLTAPSISRPHCVVEVLEHKPGGWKYLLYDIGYVQPKESSNGVLIPLRTTRLSRTEQVELQIGSTFTAGLIKFELGE